MENQVDDLIKEKFLCQAKFAQEIESLVKTYNFNYIDAILTFCEENKIEMESVSKLISNHSKKNLSMMPSNLTRKPPEQNFRYDFS